jgi:hypothetical protein
MLCQRCRGLLVHETFSDLREKTGRMCPAARCINCGFIGDSVVRANRLHPPAAKRSAPHGMVGKGGALLLRRHSERYDSL